MKFVVVQTPGQALVAAIFAFLVILTLGSIGALIVGIPLLILFMIWMAANFPALTALAVFSAIVSALFRYPRVGLAVLGVLIAVALVDLIRKKAK